MQMLAFGLARRCKEKIRARQGGTRKGIQGKKGEKGEKGEKGKKKIKEIEGRKPCQKATTLSTKQWKVR